MNLFWLVEDCFYFSCPKATLYKLNNEYHVEPYLSDPVQTYLIVSNQVTFLTPSNSLQLPGANWPDCQDPSSSETPRQLEDLDLTTGLSTADTESGEERKNSNTSIRTIQSTPKYTECMGADKPFANISNKRMMDNITRAVSQHFRDNSKPHVIMELRIRIRICFPESIKSSCSPVS